MTEAEHIRRERIHQAHLDRLTQLVNNANAARAALNRAVQDAHQAGLSWNAIGPAVGMTRQGARQRWGV